MGIFLEIKVQLLKRVLQFLAQTQYSTDALFLTARFNELYAHNFSCMNFGTRINSKQNSEGRNLYLGFTESIYVGSCN